MKFASYWHDTSVPFAGAMVAPVSGDFEVAVIGAGFTGLNAARMLAKSGVKVALIEAEHVGYGASGRNGGHLNSGHFASFGAAKAPGGQRSTADVEKSSHQQRKEQRRNEELVEESACVAGFMDAWPREP